MDPSRDGRCAVAPPFAVVRRLTDDAHVWQARGIVDVTDHLLIVVPQEPGYWPEWVPTSRVGPLLMLADRAVGLMTGVWGGPVDFELQLLDGPPDRLDDRADWEAVEEASIEPGSDALIVGPLADDAVPPFDLIALLPGQRACIRLRAHARGRATEYDGVVDDPVEEHLIQIWAEEHRREPEVLQVDDQWASQGTSQPAG